MGKKMIMINHEKYKMHECVCQVVKLLGIISSTFSLFTNKITNCFSDLGQFDCFEMILSYKEFLILTQAKISDSSASAKF